MVTKPKKELRMRKVPRDQLSLSRKNLISLFSPSPDPYLMANFNIPAEPILKTIARLREKTQKRITLNTAVIKLLALTIEKHPEFNSLVFGKNVYELEDIAITVPYLLPGRSHELTNLVVDNPHQKSLEQIHDECASMMSLERTAQAPKSRLRARVLPALVLKFRLYRLLGEKRAFRLLYQRRIGSNLVLTNATVKGAGNLRITKSAVHILRVFTRFFLHGATDIPVLENGVFVPKKVIPLAVTIDHRLIDGININQFLETLEKFASGGLAEEV
jgi:chloramphenicol O-acetyltransferase